MNLSGVPHLNQYLGAWAIEARALQSLVATCQQLDMPAHIAAGLAAQTSPAATPQKTSWGYKLSADGMAIIAIDDVMTKYGTSLSAYPGTVATRRALRAARDASDVRGILLLIDSPGGSVFGLEDLAQDVVAVQATKPVHAYIEDLGASAAYYIASQAGRLTAGRSALIGAIGSYAVLTDYSQAFAAEGIKVHVVRSGRFKGVGEEGTPIDDEELADVQRIVDAYAGFFKQAVGQGRGMSADRVVELADGRVHEAATALELGLIDGVETFDQALARATAVASGVLTMEKDVQVRFEALEKSIGDVAAAVKELADRPAPAAVLPPVGGPGLQDKHRPRAATMPKRTTYTSGRDEDTDWVRARQLVGWREETEFIRRSKDLAASDGIELKEAMRRVASDYPELYDEYRESFRRTDAASQR